MEKISPLKTIRISGKRCYIEPWMSRGLEVSSRKKLQLYAQSIRANSTNQDCINYKNYRNLYNKTKREMKINYYSKKLTECKTNTKKLWKVTNEILCKHKHKGNLIDYISIDGVKTYNPKKIANEFGKFYSRLGETLAGKIKVGNKTIEDYLSYIPCNLSSMLMKPTSQREIIKLITKLPNKTRHGHDMISNELLKKLNKRISSPLCMIFNQSLQEGIFPDLMKMAEVIPLYKGKESDKVINYRLISLLLTISKVLEKIVYNRLIKFITKHDILYDSQYGFSHQKVM